jgi:hypothetical protein
MTTSYLPAPEQLSLVRMSEEEVAEMIERHIDYVDKNGRSVHLPMPFVRHYMKRDDGVLPTVVAIAQLPIVMHDGSILAKRGLDRDRGIIFRIPEELMKLLPKDCTPAAVAHAMQFLMDEWLVDVATDYAGKCVLIAAALTLIERNLLPDRPVFFVTAGRRGGGKTTTLNMLVMAVIGTRAAAAAWSTNEEERRKAILAYFMSGLPYIIWDNIARGTAISCPHIGRSCTTAIYTDRKLGVSEMIATAASTISLFTGNNVGPRGELASRSLVVRLEVDRADPENRHFTHNDPIGWTEAHRGQILSALYTILLGSPFLQTPVNTACKTRFKVWWRLVGSAVEHAAAQHAPAERVDFKDLFLNVEEDDEESASLADMLDGLVKKWPNKKKFGAAIIAELINNRGYFAGAGDDKLLGTTLQEFLFPTMQPDRVVSPKSVGRALMRHIEEPVLKGELTLILKKATDVYTKTLTYYVDSRAAPGAEPPDRRMPPLR